MTRAQALVYDGTPHRVSLQQLELPVLQSHQALVRVVACTLCGSDLHSINGRRQVAVPTILGHEIVGELVEIGSEFPLLDLMQQPLEVGDRVTWAVVANCGECYYCRRNLPQKCSHSCKYGHMGFDSGMIWSGGLAEYCVLEAGTRVVKLPDDLTLEIVTPASCATATVSAALSQICFPVPEQESRFTIIGAGMLGLTAAAMAREQGWQQVVIVDPVESRRELAQRFGATETLTPQDWQGMIREPSTPRADVVLELAGVAEVMKPALDSLRLGGQLILVGAVFPVQAVEVLPEQIVRRQLTITGVHNYRPVDLAHAVQFLTAHGQRYPFAEMVNEWHPLAAIPDLLSNGESIQQVRVGVKP